MKETPCWRVTVPLAVLVKLPPTLTCPLPPMLLRPEIKVPPFVTFPVTLRIPPSAKEVAEIIQRVNLSNIARWVVTPNYELRTGFVRECAGDRHVSACLKRSPTIHISGEG